MTVGDMERRKIGDSEGQWDLIRLNKSVLLKDEDMA